MEHLINNFLIRSFWDGLAGVVALQEVVCWIVLYDADH